MLAARMGILDSYHLCLFVSFSPVTIKINAYLRHFGLWLNNIVDVSTFAFGIVPQSYRRY